MENFKKNNIWIIITSFVVLLVLVGVIVSISPDKFDIKNSQEGIGFVKDQQEISVFLDRVSFYFNDGIPYKYSLIEYPPLAVLYLTIPAIISGDSENYQTILIIQNFIFFLILIFVSWKIIKFIGGQHKMIWLLVLPSFIYSLVNRFDILPAVIIQIALLMLLRHKFKWSFFLLSLAFLAKGYALIFFPVFFIYYLNYRNKEKINLFNNKYLLLFIFPIGIVTLILILWSGIENALFPYMYQSNRNFAFGSPYVIYIVSALSFMPEWFIDVGIKISSKVLTLLQISVPVIIYLGYQHFKKYIKNSQDVIRWLMLVLLLYMLFSIYYSPQWIIWLLPLFILLNLKTKEIILVVVYDFINYIFFPVAWHYFGVESTAFSIIVLVRTIILVLILIYIARKIFVDKNRILTHNY